MEKLNLKATKSTPRIDFDARLGMMRIQGRSVPEDAIAFYKPLIDWLEHYKNNPASTTKVELMLDYINTNSSKFILDFFFKLSQLHQQEKSQVLIQWIVKQGDQDMVEAAEDYAAIIDVPIHIMLAEN